MKKRKDKIKTIEELGLKRCDCGTLINNDDDMCIDCWFNNPDRFKAWEDDKEIEKQ